MITGLCHGVLALIQTQRQPDNARQLRMLSPVPFGMAALTAVKFFPLTS
ncbi:hypothetical protein [Roseateles sp.]